MIACLRLLNQCHLKLYHYTSRQHLQPDHGLGFYMRVEADDRTIRLRKQRQAQYAESSDHFELASACVTFVQDVAWSLLSEPYIAIRDRRCAVVPLALLLFLDPLINIYKLLSKTFMMLKAAISLVVISLG